MELRALDTETLQQLRCRYNEELSIAIKQQKCRWELSKLAQVVLDIHDVIRGKERELLQEQYPH